MKEETKYRSVFVYLIIREWSNTRKLHEIPIDFRVFDDSRMIKYTKICININYYYYIFQKRQFRKIDLLLTFDPR